MKEINGFTCLLAAAGGLSLLLAATGLAGGERPLELLLVCLGIALVTLFPIRLPDGFYYTFDHIAAAYLLLTYDWRVAVLPTIIGLLSISVRMKARFRPFRFFVSLGMCWIPVAIASHLPIGLLLHTPFFQVCLVVLLIDGSTLLLNRGIQASILGKSLLRQFSWKPSWYQAAFSMLSAVLVFRLTRSEGYVEMAQELLFSCLTVFLLSYIAKLALHHQSRFDETKESLEQGFTATGHLILRLDREGRILTANSIALQSLQPGSSPLELQFLRDLVQEHPEEVDALMRTTAEGGSSERSVLFRSTGLAPIRVEASFLPYVRDKKVAGILVVGKIIRPADSGNKEAAV